jgi:hypothetical protein
MLKSLANMLNRKPEPQPAPPARQVAPLAPPVETPPAVRDEHTAIYQSLAMTEDIREALFPTSPRMVSAIFERPPASATPAPAPPSQAMAREAALFPIV